MWWMWLGCSIPDSNEVADTVQTAKSAADDAVGTAQVVDGRLDVPTTAGVVHVHPVQHGTLYIEMPDQGVWWVDPTGTLSKPTADVVLLTDIHGDHLDPVALNRVAKDETIIVAPLAVEAKLERPVAHVMANEEEQVIRGVSVATVPMYNLKRGPKPEVVFHEKGRGNGYLLTVGERTFYIAGDTACTEEMKALRNVDVAFVPMNLPYTMPPVEAARCVAAFKPEVVVPYHYRGSDPAAFTKELVDSGVRVETLDFYPERSATTP